MIASVIKERRPERDGKKGNGRGDVLVLFETLFATRLHKGK